MLGSVCLALCRCFQVLGHSVGKSLQKKSKLASSYAIVFMVATLVAFYRARFPWLGRLLGFRLYGFVLLVFSLLSSKHQFDVYVLAYVSTSRKFLLLTPLYPPD